MPSDAVARDFDGLPPDQRGRVDPDAAADARENDAAVDDAAIDHGLDFLGRFAQLDREGFWVAEAGQVPADLVGQALFGGPAPTSARSKRFRNSA